MGASPSPSDRQPDGPGSRRGETLMALQEELSGRYWLERELGQGGMGIVYLAWDHRLERHVALKVLPPGSDEGAARQRFLDEASIAANLKHPNIVPIHDVGEAGPFVYYTMDYIPGESLGDRIFVHGPQPMGEAIRILHDVAWAIHYAHEQGVVHRDLKPNNILLERGTGHVYVADFGLARALRHRPSRAGHDGRGGGATFGTYHYASPEQLCGLPADRRSDIYALGAVAYAMATGEPPFTGSDDEVALHHLCTPVPVPRVIGQHDDTTLMRAVTRCLAKDPAKRFQKADELARFVWFAPEMGFKLREPLREFLKDLKVQQSRSVPGGVLLAIGALTALGNAVYDGEWVAALKALGFLAVVSAWPIGAALLATRRLLEQGHDWTDILYALRMDLDRQKKEIAARWGPEALEPAPRARRVFKYALISAGIGGVLALLPFPLPWKVVIWFMIPGALGALVSGFAVVWLERHRNELWGERWLTFWESRLGGWIGRLAQVSRKLLPVKRPVPRSVPVPATSLPGGNGAAAGERDALPAVVQRTGSCIRLGRGYLATSSAKRQREGKTASAEELEFESTLERQVVVLETLLHKVSELAGGAGAAESLTADLETMREACEAAEALMDGKGWRP